MIHNMGRLDRAIRISLALAVALLYFTGVIDGTLAIVLGVIAMVFVLTSLINFCPLYKALGIHTN